MTPGQMAKLAEAFDLLALEAKRASAFHDRARINYAKARDLIHEAAGLPAIGTAQEVHNRERSEESPTRPRPLRRPA